MDNYGMYRKDISLRVKGKKKKKTSQFPTDIKGNVLAHLLQIRKLLGFVPISTSVSDQKCSKLP